MILQTDISDNNHPTMAGGGGYQPDHCWELERIPWWEPPYLLHNGREEVRLGRKEGNSKVCQGYQVSRNHALFVRSGTAEDWHGVRWCVVDQGGLHGTYVNQIKIDPHTPFPLNADDLIGLGSPDITSTRQGGRETFVYRIRAPKAFQQMDADTADLDVLDGDAPTPPPASAYVEDNDDQVRLPEIELPAPVRTTDSSFNSSSQSQSISNESHPSTSIMSSTPQKSSKHTQPGPSVGRPSSSPGQGSASPVKRPATQSSGLSRNNKEALFGRRQVEQNSDGAMSGVVRYAVGQSTQRHESESDRRGVDFSKAGHTEVITLSDDEEPSENTTNRPMCKSKAIDESTTALKRKRKIKDNKNSRKKLKQIFGSDSENEARVEESKVNPGILSSSTPDRYSSSKTPLSPISSEEEGAHAKNLIEVSKPPVKETKESSLPLTGVSLPVLKDSSKQITPQPTSTANDSSLTTKSMNSVAGSIPVPISNHKTQQSSIDKAATKTAVESLSESRPTSLSKVSSESNTDPDLEKLAEKIKAARRMQAVQPSDTVPVTNIVKLELPVLSIKKEVPDSDLPPIKLTGGYSQEPEVITICDSDDEEDYHAKHSQGRHSIGYEEDVMNEEIKEEIMSDTERQESYSSEESEDDEEVQILRSSENKLFAAISKRIKIEFDDSLELDAQNFVDEVIADDKKEQELINMIMETVGCNEDIAICGVAQAKENFDCNEPTVEQVVEVITGESSDSLSEVDDSFEQSIEESVVDDLPELASSSYKIPKMTSKSAKKSIKNLSEFSDSSIDDLLEGLDDDDDPGKESEKKRPSVCNISPKCAVKLSTKLSKDLFDDEINDKESDDDNEVLKKAKSIIAKPSSSREDSKSQSLANPNKSFRGSRLIEPLAMPKRRGMSERTKVSSNESERKSLLETLHRSKPKAVAKPFYRQIGEGEFRSKEKEKLVAERKLKLASLATKSKKVVSVKETKAPVGIMKMSQPKNHSLLIEMSSCDSMQPKRKPVSLSKTKPVVFRPKIMEKSEENQNQVPRKEQQKEHNVAVSISEPQHHDQFKLDEEKRKKYAETSDGYIVPKKMSVSNIEYSRIELQPEPLKQPSRYSSILRKKGKKSYLRKNVSWLDQNGFHCLVDVKEIPSNNMGKKCNNKNNKDTYVKIQQDSQNGPKVARKEVLMDDIFVSILNWNTLWLEEQKKMAEPPPVHHPYQLIPVTNTFSNWEEYRKIFLPLMLQELWSSISKEYEEKKSTREDIVPVCLQEVNLDPKGKFLVVRCMGLLTEQEMRRDCGVEGILVQLNISFNLGSATADGKQAREIKPCFGFVQSIKRVPFRKEFSTFGEFDLERIKRLESLAVKNKQRMGVVSNLVYYTIRVKLNLVPPERKLSIDKPIYMKAISRVRPELRKFEAILDLPQSSLFESIVSPKKETLQVPQVGQTLHTTLQTIPQMCQLNQCQKEIIVSVSHACVLQPEVPRICLVQGPPGTGKSSTIAGLILQILYSKMVSGNVDTMPRILVVAPSNAAVDELALKLIALKSKLAEQIRFRLVRLGVQKSMHQKVRSCSFDTMVEEFITAQTRQAKASESLEKDKRSKQSAANQIYAEKIKAENEGNTDLAAKLTRDYKEKIQQVEKIQAELKKPLDSRSKKDLERIASDRVMASSDIILATLSSSLGGQMEKYFVQGMGTCKEAGPLRPVSVCIMDEASQCVEPEALIPFKLGFAKLVMVGDHEQLPATVTSRKAQQLDYQQSLFGRLFSYFTGISGGRAGETVCPVLKLVTQYRMHKEIASWPAKYFYGGNLHYGGQDRASCLPPYTVLGVAGETKQLGGHCWNLQEQVVVMATVEAIKSLVGDKFTIGIVTFYAKQKQNIILEVQNRRFTNIVVNTVDGFQGSERDIIIISCVRSGGGGIGFLQDRQRLNVALTRAKYSLVVVGNMDTLSKATAMWAELLLNAQSRGMKFNLDLVKDSINKDQLRSIMLRKKMRQS